ncbi:aminopeptidase [Anaerorhabdus furcosa]|uniref:M18 family aminopeptidase n=1 Tax=Anaerorhabdus furcosa TaxID=118967 RepID=A0A1T4NJZ4_9FIRM|nr:aminopeptidase [Anaerorhabdus furcosa]SJZ79584.1 Aspartyl aminopeptidase [Anaerorhabdus furcosa]
MKTVWEKLSNAEMKAVFEFSEGYKKYLDAGKTERECVTSAVALAKKSGFKDFAAMKNKKLKAGDKVYFINKEKNLCLYVIGSEPLVNGLNILGAHIDSPRIDVKQVPLYEQDGLVLMDTHYYGGIKKYQWVAQPMALHGVICKKDGTKIVVAIGEKESDPVVGISDLLIHLAQEQLTKTASKVVEGEDLNLLVGSIPSAKAKENKVKAYLLDLLKKDYNIEEDDFISAELEIVPAGKARDYGLDRSMVMGYGHDDRICAYTSLIAILEMNKPKRTSCCILVDKEEIGSTGNTGMQSRFFENTIAELLEATSGFADLKFRKTLENSKMLSSDVSAGFDPNYPSVFEKKNTAFLGMGLCLNKYTGSRGKGGSSDANPEFIAQIRNLFDTAKVQFQTAELGRVDAGGGGTIAYILANLNMEVIDAGIAVQNMHAPYEVASKADIYEAYRGYKAFLEKMK